MRSGRGRTRKPRGQVGGGPSPPRPGAWLPGCRAAGLRRRVGRCGGRRAERRAAWSPRRCRTSRAAWTPPPCRACCGSPPGSTPRVSGRASGPGRLAAPGGRRGLLGLDSLALCPLRPPLLFLPSSLPPSLLDPPALRRPGLHFSRGMALPLGSLPCCLLLALPAHLLPCHSPPDTAATVTQPGTVPSYCPREPERETARRRGGGAGAALGTPSCSDFCTPAPLWGTLAVF